MDAVTAVLLMESSMGKMFGEISVLKSCFQPDLDSEFPKIEADVLHKLGLGPDPEEAAAAAAAATAAAELDGGPPERRRNRRLPLGPDARGGHGAHRRGPVRTR